MLVYALATAIIEGFAMIVLLSLGYPNTSSPSSVAAWEGSPAYPVFFNFVLFLLAGGAIGQEGPSSSGSYDPTSQIVGGVIGMFIIVAIVGEALVWLSGEIAEIAKNNGRIELT